MKRTIRRSLLSISSAHSLFAATWLEQFAIWVAAIGVDWTKLPWAFAGASVATLKAKKDPQGNVIHKPFWEWLAGTLGGTIIGLAGWQDVVNITKLTPIFSTLIAGLIGWKLADIILKQAIKQLSDSDSTLPKP